MRRRTRLARRLVSTELRVPDGTNQLYSWIDPNGKFYPVGAKSHHSEFAEQFGGIGPLMDKGWGRITWYGTTVYFNGRKPPTTKQLRSLKDAAIEAQKREIVFDNDLTGDDKTLWQDGS